jgi:hypothetical protein
VEDAVEQDAFDADVVVEPLQVAQVGHGRSGVGVGVRGTVAGDVQAAGLGEGGGAQPDGDATAPGDVRCRQSTAPAASMCSKYGRV